jgi:dTDP-glucose pyrophosphorylase
MFVIYKDGELMYSGDNILNFQDLPRALEFIQQTEPVAYMCGMPDSHEKYGVWVSSNCYERPKYIIQYQN